jgi:hypothetical protein
LPCVGATVFEQIDANQIAGRKAESNELEKILAVTAPDLQNTFRIDWGDFT